jgi:hypothetical protein
VWVSLTICPLRLHIKDRIFAPLPFVVYLRKEILEQESYPIAVVRQETIEKVLRAVDRSPLWVCNKTDKRFSQAGLEKIRRYNTEFFILYAYSKGKRIKS